MLTRIREQRTNVDRVRTGNAFSNEPMLAINDALGFTVVEIVTEWQGTTRELLRAPTGREALNRARDPEIRQWCA